MPARFPAHRAAFCCFTWEGMSLAPGVYVSQDAVYGASWYEKTAILETKPASSSGFFACQCGETRARTSEGRPMEWLLWVRLGALIIQQPKRAKLGESEGGQRQTRRHFVTWRPVKRFTKRRFCAKRAKSGLICGCERLGEAAKQGFALGFSGSRRGFVRFYAGGHGLCAGCIREPGRLLRCVLVRERGGF